MQQAQALENDVQEALKELKNKNDMTSNIEETLGEKTEQVSIWKKFSKHPEMGSKIWSPDMGSEIWTPEMDSKMDSKMDAKTVFIPGISLLTR